MKSNFFAIFFLFFCTLFFAQINSLPVSAIKDEPAEQASKKHIEKLISEKQWNLLFPNRFGVENGKIVSKDFYNYQDFINAGAHFLKFLNDGSEEIQKRELSAFLANISQETSGGWYGAPGGYYAWGLHFIEENNGENTQKYSDSTKINFLPVSAKKYFGRGPFQISWNYNYGQFSEAWFGDKNILLQNPEMVSENSEIAFASAVWFWMSAQYPKPSCHDVIVGNWKPTDTDIQKGRLSGFGTVVNIVNGGIECNTDIQDKKTLFRYNYYQYFCDFFKVSAGENISCHQSVPFGR